MILAVPATLLWTVTAGEVDCTPWGITRFWGAGSLIPHEWENESWGRGGKFAPWTSALLLAVGARYASCWNESCREHASGSYTTKHSDLNTCISHPVDLQVNGCVIFEYLPGGRGMEAAPSNGELHMASVWRSRSGLIRVEHDYALPAMELPFEPLKTVKKKSWL